MGFAQHRAARALLPPLAPALPQHCTAFGRDLPDLLASSGFPNTCGKLRITNIIERLSKFGEEHGPLSASSMSNPWTASSTPSSSDSTWNGEPAPSAFFTQAA
jgi:hypothetical protein